MSKRNKQKNNYVPSPEVGASAAPDAPYEEPKAAKSKKPLIVGLIGVIILAAIVGAGFAFFGDTKDDTDTNNQGLTELFPPEQAPPEPSDAQKAALKNYSQLLNEGKYQDARAAVKDLEASDAQKQAMLEDIASVEDQSSELSKYLAMEGTPEFNYSIADLIGDIYAGKGDSAKAKVYYQKAVQLLEKSDVPTKEDDSSLIRGKIDAL